MTARFPDPDLVEEALDADVFVRGGLTGRVDGRRTVVALVAADVGAEEPRLFARTRVRLMRRKRVRKRRVMVVGLPFAKVIGCPS